MAAQVPDIIIVDGEKMELYSNPLEQYWDENKVRRPEFEPSVTCKRGYIATWEVNRKYLMLRNVEGYVRKQYFFFWNKIANCSLNMLFNKNDRERVIANWFTGKIRIPLGRRTLYVHDGYDSRFEKEMVITIDHGRVLKTVILDYAKHKLEIVV